MRPSIPHRSTRRGSLAAGAGVAALALATSVAAQQLPPQNPVPPSPMDPAPNAKFRTWFYDESGKLVWDRHQFYEDPANTVFSLAHDFVTGLPGQVGSYPDVLLLNYAQFEPPEGEPATTRHLALDSIHKKGLQLWVNYGDSVIDPAGGSETFRAGSFFVSMDSPNNDQTVPSVPDFGFIGHSISATRAALGYYQGIEDADPEPHPGEPSSPPQVPLFTPPSTPNAIYVTASIGYGKSDIDPLDHSTVDTAWDDRLLVYDAALQTWVDRSNEVPASARLGNSSGVAFADFDGDGHHDLYVGKCGDNWAGEENVLCIYDPVSGKYLDETATRIPNEYVGATNDVAAADLDDDDDLDIVVANRMKRGGAAGSESIDYVLWNDGTGHFTIEMLGEAPTDTRSVAVGDIDHVLGADEGLEIVLGNAGNDGHSSALEFPTAENHAMQIFRDVQVGPGVTYADRMDSEFLTADLELEVTTPRTLQVILRDVVGASGASPWTPDGWVDLVIVNHRESLKNEVTISTGQKKSVASHVAVLKNLGVPPAGPSDRWFARSTAIGTYWGQTVAIADFVEDGLPEAPEDFFVGSGNRFSGAASSIAWNRGSAFASKPEPWGELNGTYDLWPGTEHGYGFDFADWNGNGIMDAVQTARTYDYLVKDIDEASGHVHPHLEISLSGQLTSNKRGRLNPQGMEDACFADFDRNGKLDALVAGQRLASESMPVGYPLEEQEFAESVVLENVNNALFAHDSTFEVLSDGTTQVLLDDKIDLNGRNASRYPTIADRVVCGDMDNDGDEDAIVHLFGLIEPPAPPQVGNDFLAKIEGPEFPEFPTNRGRYSLGWRYLKNVIGDAGTPAGIWFKDIAARSMRNAAGVFDTTWNRGLGSDVLGDFDNNGALDLYTTSGRSVFAANGPHGSTQSAETHQVEDILQTDDLLFVNGRTAALGVLVETGSLLPPRAVDEIGLLPKDSAGSFGVTQGDVDNDGRADVVVMHYDGLNATTLPWLLMNRIATTSGPFTLTDKFLNEFEARMDWSTLSPLVHTTAVRGTNSQPIYPSTSHPGVYCDLAQFCALLDWDGDGDLDLVYVVDRDLPRFWQNKGDDTNDDGVIDVRDTSPRGYFEDVTDTILEHHKTSLATNDMAVVDVDGDGDLDFAVDPFSDAVTLWRNDQVLGVRPRVAEIWPRVGTKRGGTITLHGANLTGIEEVVLHFTDHSTTPPTVHEHPITTGITVLSDTRATVQIPDAATLPHYGLAQVRVRRVLSGNDWWSRQYAGYFVLQ